MSAAEGTEEMTWRVPGEKTQEEEGEDKEDHKTSETFV